MAKKVSRELSRALKLAGGQKALAERLGVSPSTVRRWALKGVPQSRQEQLSGMVVLLGQRPKVKTSQRPQELLKKALRKAQNATELALELGVSLSTVRRWVKKKPSDAGVLKLQRFLETQQAYQVAVKAERERLKELLGFAGKIDKIPHHETGGGSRSGERTQGWRYSKRWGRELTSGFIQVLERWVRSLKRHYRYWQAVVRMLHFEPTGSREFKRSGPNVWMQVGKQDDFLVDATMTTIRVGSRENLIGELRGMLEEVLEQGFYAYIVGITVFNYRLRTEEERRIWIRNKRFRQKAKKKKPKQGKLLPGKQKLLLPPKT